MTVPGFLPSSSIARQENAVGLRERFVVGRSVLRVRYRQAGYGGRIVPDVAGDALGFQNSEKFGQNFREEYFACTGTEVMHIPGVRGAHRGSLLESAVIVPGGQP